MTLFQGDTIDRYVIDGPLGAGGMGEVYRAKDTRLKRTVALKILRPASASASGQSEGAARMLREAILAAALDHPNVIAIFDVGEVSQEGPLKGTTYIAMELIKGRSLRALIGDASLPTVDVRRRVRWLTDVARALAAAHDAHLVHRDIKPDNVMIGDNGVVKVLDFGIARKQHGTSADGATTGLAYANTMTAEGVIIGTPLYMSPEQMRDEDLDGRADQFAWGVLAYELLTGTTPWGRNGASAGVVMSQILSAPPPSLEPYGAVPDAVKAVVLRALEKDRAARFPSMHEIVAELEPYGEAVRSTPGRVSIGDVAVISSAQTVPSIAPISTVKPASDAFAATEKLPPSAAPLASSPSSQDTGAATARTGRESVVAPAPSRRGAAIVAAIVLGAAAIAGGVAWRARRGATSTAGAAPSTSAAGTSASAGGAGECTTSAACIAAHAGEAYRCREDHACVKLATDGCVVRAEPSDLGDDRTAWIGVRLRADSPLDHETALQDRNTIELARRDFAALPALLPGAHGTAARRPIAVLDCSESRDAARATKHLVDEVRVPAIIGFSSSQEAIDLLTTEVVPHATMAVLPISTSSLVTSIATPARMPRLIWRTTNNTTQIARAMSAMVTDAIEPRLHAEGRATIDVALVRPDNAGGAGLSDAIVSALRFNGGSVADNQTHFAEYIVAPDAAPARVLDVVMRLKTQHPNVVLFFGSQYVARIFSDAERTWPTGAPRPYYVSGLPLMQLDETTVDARLFKRLFGVTTPSNTPANAKFALHYNATFDDRITLGFAPNTTYDAFYVLGYAAYAVDAGPLTGATLADAVRRLVGPGAKIEVGPARIMEGVAELAAGRSIDLDGAGSALDFDLATGEDPTDHVILSVGRGVDGKPIGVESGLVFDAHTGKLRGALHNPL